MNSTKLHARFPTLILLGCQIDTTRSVEAVFLERPQACATSTYHKSEFGGQKRIERQIDNFPNLKTKLQSCNMAYVVFPIGTNIRLITR